MRTALPAAAAAGAAGAALFGTAAVAGATAPKAPTPAEAQNRRAAAWGAATVLAGAASAAAAAAAASPEQRVVAGVGAGVATALGAFVFAHGAGGTVSPIWWFLPIGGAAFGSAVATEVHRAVTG
jgi:hypothetical protein